MPVLKPQALLDERIMAIRAEHLNTGIKRAELDLSGGIDSAVMAGILVLALGPENVTLAHTRMSTNGTQSQRARDLAKALDCRLADGGFGGAFEVIKTELIESLVKAGYDRAEIDARVAADPTILGSIRSCLRAPLGRGYNRLTGGGLRYGTGNECEDRFLRFYQKGGDGEVDNNPMAFLSKGEVYQLAVAISVRIPKVAAAMRATIAATPSPDLWGTGDGHSDEAELLSWTGAPFTYSRVDPDTGEYSHVGTIERVSRFLDEAPVPEPIQLCGLHTIEAVLFCPGELAPEWWPLLVTAAKRSGYFNEFSRSEVETLLMAARKVERITRHKENPNCPTYGDREILVTEGILTNDLPAIAG